MRWSISIDWRVGRAATLYKVRDHGQSVLVEELEVDKLRSEIEPWLTALFRREHLSLLMGGGISSAVHLLAKNEAVAEMGQISFAGLKSKSVGRRRRVQNTDGFDGPLQKTIKENSSAQGIGPAVLED